MKALFVIPDLSGRNADYKDYASGRLPFSCSRGSWLRVVEGLAGRGHEIGCVTINGDVFSGTQALVLPNLASAVRWASGAAVVACSWGNAELVPELNALGVSPRLWLKTHLDNETQVALEQGKLEAILVPSDFARLYALHSRSHKRIGRIYNPLAPIFEQACIGSSSRFSSQTTVFAGNIGENKGAHVVLSLWSRIRRRMPSAKLVMAGSPKLYDENSSLGSLGVGSAVFERNYVQPLVREFGSLEQAGVDFVGSLPPADLVELYQRCALGVANLNWTTSVETFGCAITEMLSTGLPTLGFARGALIETAGPSGAAILQNSSDLDQLALKAIELLSVPDKLEQLGKMAAEFAKWRYASHAVLDAWETILGSPADKAFRASGRWQCPGRLRYVLERGAGMTGVGSIYIRGIAAARGLKQALRGRQAPEQAIAASPDRH